MGPQLLQAAVAVVALAALASAQGTCGPGCVYDATVCQNGGCFMSENCTEFAQCAFPDK